ncbi:hypothetical protein GCM10007036_27480 [Alsobacter metallidurans]|uniref:Cobalt transporter subunit CbtA n=1 Tax=Alsobacter metallidurans TaxID=340221 RepID=A0A917MHT9_9HYPH|nr:CbtA family protein [Alsobacter metallidurans]GGH22454.1 hypothetical protein GCM10007036_27480 [Alsobacter metallidurans]
MSVFRSIVFTAAAAGLLVGLTVTGLQQVRAVPLILKAEVYEQKAEAAPAAPAALAPHAHEPGVAPHSHAESAAPHEHGAAWQPAEGFQRNAFTALFNVVTWIGFGLGLAGLMVIARRPATWREGLIWGLGGFAALTLAPSIGLPPELPGMPAADVVARQFWWVGAALSTAMGLGLIALTRAPLPCIAGALLLVAPHLVGAPQPPTAESAVPDAMARDFVTAVMVSAFVSWALLGALTGFFLNRFRGSESEA